LRQERNSLLSEPTRTSYQIAIRFNELVDPLMDSRTWTVSCVWLKVWVGSERWLRVRRGDETRAPDRADGGSSTPTARLASIRHTHPSWYAPCSAKVFLCLMLTCIAFLCLGTVQEGRQEVDDGRSSKERGRRGYPGKGRKGQHERISVSGSRRLLDANLCWSGLVDGCVG
jgi:hypothetical protein